MGIPTMSDLYVMQNHVGLIKIGHSLYVEARRKAIEKTHGCTIELVAIVNGAGDREKGIHHALDQFRCLGEWFDGIDEAKKAIIGELGLDPETVWPIPLASAEVVDSWLSSLSEKMFQTHRYKETQKLIREMTTFGPPANDASCRALEARIFGVYWRFVRCRTGGVDVSSDIEGNPIYTGVQVDENGQWVAEAVPSYLSQMEAALSLWPEDERPLIWDGHLWDCCIAALMAQKILLFGSGKQASRVLEFRVEFRGHYGVPGEFRDTEFRGHYTEFRGHYTN